MLRAPERLTEVTEAGVDAVPRRRPATTPPIISVIIPALQEEELISSTLSCIPAEVRQRYGIEVVVSDGGSTDRTVDLAREGAERVVERNPACRENIAIGRNHGARCSRGDVLVFINADVRIADCERFFDRITSMIWREDIVAVTCGVRVFPEQEGPADKVFHRFFNYWFRLMNVMGMGMGRGECHVMKREIFERVGGYNEALAAGEDYELFVRLRRHGTVAFLRDVYVYESPRRYRRYGYLRITLLWFLNGFWALLFKRSFVHRWEPVR